MEKILLASDLHLHTNGDGRCTASSNHALMSVVDYFNFAHEDAALCVFLGDLTHSGSRQEYAQLRSELSRLRIPYRLLPGNHDDREQLAAAFPEQAHDENGFLQSAVQLDEVRMVFLDTCESGSCAGHYCTTRRNWLERELSAQLTVPRVLCSHHPFGITHVARVDVTRVRPIGDCIKLLQLPTARVAMLVSGHTHFAYFGSYLGIPAASMPSLSVVYKRTSTAVPKVAPLTISAIVGILTVSANVIGLCLESLPVHLE